MLAALAPGRAAAQSRPAVVALGEGDDLRAALRVGRAVRSALRAKGQQPIDPARALRPLASPAAELARADERFRAGLALYDSLEFKKAEAAFQESVAASRAAMVLGAPPKGYVRTLHYLAASSLFESRKQDARSHFCDAIAFAPTERPDTKVFSPEVVAAYEDARGQPKGTLKVSLRASEVGEVIVDRRHAGIAPVTLPGVAPGHHLVEVRRAGRAPTLSWKSVAAGGETAVELELATPESLGEFRGAEASARKELGDGKPGSGIAKLRELLQAGAVVVVAREGAQVVAGWAEGSSFTRRYQGNAPEGQESAFAEGLLAAGAAAPGCTSARDCGSGEECRAGRCVAGSTPVYKRWWFWTAIGAAVVAGATAGLVVGLKGRKVEWSAELATRGGL